MITLFLSNALAQQATPAVVEAVQKVGNAIPESLPAWALMGLVLIGELVMRLFPTAKPKSFLLAGSWLFSAVANVFTKASKLLDEVVQNLKDDPKPEEKK
jgi:hypothetical protein